METKYLFRLVPLIIVSCFSIGCSSGGSSETPASETSSQINQSENESSTAQSFENVPLRFGIELKNRNDVSDSDPLLTNVSYICYVGLDANNSLEGEPVFTYNHDLADIIVSRGETNSIDRYFCLAIKDTASENFELNVEWRTQKLTKKFVINKVTDLATCLYDYEADTNQRQDYDDYTVVDTNEKYNTLKTTLKNYVGGYQFPNVTFTETFLLVRYFYVSGYVHFKYNQCFLYKEKVMIDYNEEYNDRDIYMVVSGVHFTLLQLPNEYKNSDYISHNSYVRELK